VMLRRWLHFVTAPNPERARAAFELTREGAPAVKLLLEAILAKSDPAVGYLESVLMETRCPEAVDLYAELLDRDDLESFEAVGLGLRALGATRDPRATPHLARYLEDRTRLWRDEAARALGELRDPKAHAPLLAYTAEIVGERVDANAVRALADRCARDYEMRPIRALVAMSIGLGRLGDQALAVVPITLVGHTFPRRTDREDAIAVRIEAAYALRHVVGKGLVGAMGRAIVDREPEIKRAGAYAAFLLGTEPCVELLASAAASRDPVLRCSAPIWVHRIFAKDEEVEETSAAAFRHWLAKRPTIPDGVTFRMGKPRDEADVVELLGTNAYADEALAELRITIGDDFGASLLVEARDQRELLPRARRVVRETPLPPGSLVRHGRVFTAPTT